MHWLLLACLPPEADSGADTGAAPAPEAEVSIPAGTFTMGCDTCDPDEAPTHEVSLSAYALSSTEVTARQWAACEAARACPAASVPAPVPDAPVTGVTFEEAEAYCAWKGMRLPTEAEWERAARGPDATRWPWGEDAPDCERVASRACDGGLARVDAHPDGASAEGALGLVGNAWEWVSDLYDPDYYASSPTEDPAGATRSGLRTVRGIDSWSDPDALRPSNRTYAIPDASGPLVGFRCARSVE